MGRFTDWFKRSGSPENPANPISVIFDIFQKTNAGVPMGVEKSLNISAVWRAVNLISSSVATLPIHTYRRTDRGKDRVEHPVRGLLRRPNDFMSGVTLLETVQAHALTWGNGYAVIDRDGGNRPVALWPVRPDRVSVVVVEEGFRRRKEYFITLGQGAGARVPVDDMIHIHGLSNDGLQGRSVITAARESLGLTSALEEFGARFFGNGANSSVVIRFPQGTRLTTAQKQSLAESWRQARVGLENSHKTVLLEDGAELQKLTIPPDDGQFLESRTFQTQEIARWFGVPPSMLYENSRSTFSNSEQQGLDFNVDTLRPWLVRWEAEINDKLFSEAESEVFFVEFLMDALLRADADARGSFYDTLAKIGAITINEIRARENLPPVEGGDRHFVRRDTIPLDSVDDLVDALPDQPRSEVLPQPTEARLLPAPDPELEWRQTVARRDAARPLFEREATTILRRESDMVRRLLRQNASRDALNASLEEFYDEHGEWVAKRLREPVKSYVQPVMAAEGGMVEEPDEWIDGFAEREGEEWARESRTQLQALETPEDVEQRLDEWQEKRPAKYAAATVVAAETAARRASWRSQGKTLVRWRTRGNPCEMCDEMDGAVVSIEGAFALPGDDIQGGEGTEFKSKQILRGPPLHNGCVCEVSAV